MATRRDSILADVDPALAEFLDFVLSQYVEQDSDELDVSKLPGLLGVRYGSPSEGVRALGVKASEVQQSFRGFQRRLYD